MLRIVQVILILARLAFPINAPGAAPVSTTAPPCGGSLSAHRTVVVNHFKSKGSCPASGPDGDTGQGCWNIKRVTQATAVLDFAAALEATAPDVLVIGDLNAYGGEDPSKVLFAGGLVNQVAKVRAAERYTYIFDGQAGYLDHALATTGLAGQMAGATLWHINADEPAVLDYNTEFKPQDLYSPIAYRAADHDPVIMGLALTASVRQVFLSLLLTHMPVPSPTVTPTPSVTPTATWTKTATAPSTRLPTSTVTPTPTPSPTATGGVPPGNDLRIVELSYSGTDEYVTIRNNGPSNQVLTGWRIVSVVGTQTFYFPAGYALAGGATVRVHSGPAAPSTPPGDLRWTTGYIWNNDGDKAELRDSGGALVDRRCYKAGCP